METNFKVVGFANQSINGVTTNNQGFDMEYDGKQLNVSGFSGDKLYYAKLNNKQLIDILNVPSSSVPLEKRIKQYKRKSNRKSHKKLKLSKKSKKSSTLSSRKSSTKKRTSSPYITPKLRSP